MLQRLELFFQKTRASSTSELINFILVSFETLEIELARSFPLNYWAIELNRREKETALLFIRKSPGSLICKSNIITSYTKILGKHRTKARGTETRFENQTVRHKLTITQTHRNTPNWLYNKRGRKTKKKVMTKKVDGRWRRWRGRQAEEQKGQVVINTEFILEMNKFKLNKLWIPLVSLMFKFFVVATFVGQKGGGGCGRKLRLAVLLSSVNKTV